MNANAFIFEPLFFGLNVHLSTSYGENMGTVANDYESNIQELSLSYAYTIMS